VQASRVHNIVITLDKVKHVLRQQQAEVAAKPLLRILAEEEVRGGCRAAAGPVQAAAAAHGGRAAGRAWRPPSRRRAGGCLRPALLA
jgi:hypothetical protein